METSPYLDFVFYVDDVETFRERIDVTLGVDTHALAERHAHLTEKPNAEDKPWRMECHDPDGILPPFRIGTDTRRMIIPQPASPENVADWLDRADPRRR